MTRRPLLDTNILIYSRDEASPFLARTVNALQNLVLNKVTLCIHRLILREYVSVATKPAPKGLGASIERALQDVEEFEAFYFVLPEPVAAWSTWKQLLKDYDITGLRIHDAYIAAIMMTYNIPAILTVNIEDFKSFPAVKPIEPGLWYKVLEA